MLGMSIFQLLATAGSTFSSEIAKKISNLF
jgi:hypothetical protein